MGKSKSNVDQLNALPGNLSALNAALAGKQAALVSGTNIKTVNGNSLLGSGDLVIAGAQVNAVTSVAGKTGAVTLAKADVGLGNVDNTPDASKSVLSATKLTTARTLTIGSTGKSFDGSAALSWSLAEIGAAPTTTPTITGLREVRAALPANNIDLALGNVFTKTISGASILTVSNVPAAGVSASFILKLTNGGSAGVAWWAGVKWPGGTPPTLTVSGRDNIYFQTDDGGTTWDAAIIKDVK